MRKATMTVAAAAMTLGLATSALAADAIYSEDFATDVGDWAGDIAHQPADETAAVSGYSFSWFGSAIDRTVWPEHGYVTELDVYLDPAALDEAGDGFDYTVASYNQSDSHLRDFIFHVGVAADGRLLVNGSNNTDFGVNSFKLLNDGDGTPTEITTAGWYTLQHVFRDAGDGSLAVDLKVLNTAGDEIFTTTRNNPADTLTDVVGGVGYGWIIFVDGTDNIDIDNHELTLVVPTPGDKDDCKNGGFESFGFENQGQCVASLQANANAGK